MFHDFKELLSIFNARGVKYLIVGGYAVSFHAQPRATKDIDVLIKPDADNARAVYDALAEFGAPLGGLKPEDFAERGKFFRIGSPPVMVDLLPEIKGVNFDGAWRRRVEAVIDADSELTAYFISSEDLIAAKAAAGRPQDIADVAALREAVKPRKPRRRRAPRKANGD
jgi:predicted nucleotidyltransferase